MTSHTITTILSTLPHSVQKNVIKTFAGSINSSIIGYARSHIRKSRYENISRDLTGDERPTIDRYNEARSAEDVDTAMRLSMEDNGAAPASNMPPLEVAQHLAFIRAHLSEEMIAMAAHPRDALLSLEDTLAFQISRAPNIDRPALTKLIDVLDLQVDVEELVAIKQRELKRDREELIDMRGQIMDLTSSFDFIIDASSGAEVEALFDKLPAPIQYRLVVSIGRALQSTGKQALSRIMRGNLDAAGDVKMIAPVIEDCRDWLQELYRKHSSELDAFSERGGSLPELN